MLTGLARLRRAVCGCRVIDFSGCNLLNLAANKVQLQFSLVLLGGSEAKMGLVLKARDELCIFGIIALIFQEQDRNTGEEERCRRMENRVCV